MEEEEEEDIGDESNANPFSLPSKAKKRTITRKRQRELENHEKQIMMKKKKRDENPVTEEELKQQWDQLEKPMGGRVPLKYAIQLELVEGMHFFPKGL